MSKKNKKPLTKAKKNLLITLLVLVVMGASVDPDSHGRAG